MTKETIRANEITKVFAITREEWKKKLMCD